MNTEKLKVGCIGAGVLGGAITRRLIQCGYAPVVWNRDRSKLSALLTTGAVEAGSPEQLARASTFVITCISDGAAVESVVFGEHGIAAGGTADKILVDMSTCAPAHTQKMAVRLVSERGMRWLDAPISGGAPAALEGRMAIMVGGDPDTFERARPLWDGGRWSRRARQHRAGELLPGQQPLIEPRQAPTLMVPAK